MNGTDATRINNLAMSDQCWMELDENLDDLNRLADVGVPNSERDVLLIRQALCVVCADIHTRRANRTPVAPDTPDR